MSTLKPFLKAAGAALLFLSAAACFRIHVIEDCRDPGARFVRASREIARLQSENPGRLGRAREICFLVHERGGQLVEVRTSLALFQAALGLAADIGNEGGDFDFEGRYGLAWRELKDLGRFGPGLLIEVEDEEDRVLIWLR